jgi:filamentous hemagglutinin family protein
MNRPGWLCFSLVALSAGLVSEFSPQRVLAQSITPAADDTGTIVSADGNTWEITGGTTAGSNLFHSFQQFGLDTGETANFQSTPSIANILGRVTGGSPSYINGLLQVSNSSANLYLINPAGMVFGANAQLNLAGSFTASTASGLHFTDGIFSAVGQNTYDLLVGAPNDFLFPDTGTIGSIANFGDLAVQSGQNLNLVAGTIVSPGNLSAVNGTVSLVTVDHSDRVRLSQTGMILGLDLPAPDAANPLGFSPLTLPNLLTGGEVNNASALVISADGISLEGSGVRIENGDLMAQEIHSGRVQVQAAGDVVLAPVDSAKPVAIVATEDLKIKAADTVTVRDSPTQPVQILSGGNLEITGLDAIDILALDHLDLGIPFQSGGDLTLISDGLISSDSHFFSGGNFSLLNSANSPTSFFSLYDPIITATGNVTFGPYNGTSLKVEAGGSITVAAVASTVSIPGNIFITGPDATLDNTGTDPDIPILTSGSAVILRAGVTSFSDSSVAVTVLPSIVAGTNFSSTSPAGTGSITVQGSISGNQLANVILEATDFISIFDNITADAAQSSVVINAGATSTVSTAGITGNQISMSGGTLNLGGTIASGTGSLTLTGDEVNWTNPISGQGSLLIQPLTPGLNMELAGVAPGVNEPDPTPLNLTLAELNQLQDGFTDITIGRINSSGALTLAGDVTSADPFADPLTLRSPTGFGSVNTGGFNLTGDTSITLQAGNTITIPTGTTITSSGTPVDIILNSDRDSSGLGAIVINGATIDSNGGNIALVGGATGTEFAQGANSNPNGVNAQGTRTNPDGVNITDSTVTAEGGAITIRGEGFDSSADPINNNRGVNLNNSTVTTTTSGSIDIQGTGGSGLSFQDGVLMIGGTISTDTGNITLTGSGGIAVSGAVPGSGSYNRGAYLTGTIASTSGDITVTGTGGVGTQVNEGVALENGGVLSTSGNILIEGTGGTTGANTPGDDNRGVAIVGGVNTSGTGQITITGTGGSGVNNNAGTEIFYEAIVSSESGLITITGTGSSTATGDFNRGIGVDGRVSSSTGNILLTGTGGTGINSNAGIDILSRGVLRTAGNTSDPNQVSGVELVGLGSATATGDFNRGVAVEGTIEGEAAGAVQITGTARSGFASNSGVEILNGSTVLSNEGSITVSGTGSATSAGSFNRGINLPGILISNGGGSIFLTGIGGTGTNFNSGVDVLDTGSLTVFDAGSVAITGTAGSGTSDNDGVRVQGSISGSGGITLSGESSTSTGTGNEAIEVTNTANLQVTGTGSLALNSDRPQANQGDILVDTNLTTNGGNITSSAGGNVIVNGTIATRGGDVSIDSDGTITVGILNTTLPPGDGGAITLLAAGDVNTGLIDTGSKVITATGNAQSGNGGSVILSAGGSLNVTNIDTASLALSNEAGAIVSSGSGGDVTLNGLNPGSAVNINLGIATNAGFFCGGGGCSFPNLNNLSTGLGGAIDINAPGGLNIGGQLFTSATRQGGSVDINSGGDVVISQGINTQSNLSLAGASTSLLNGGDVRILTAGNITIPSVILTGSVTTANPANSATAGAGGFVELTSGDVITVGDIRTSTQAFSRFFEDVGFATSGNAGDITLIATNAITAGNLEANSQWANGGNIFLDPIGDITFITADATGATNGGNLTFISTGSNVRATGRLGVEANALTRTGCIGASICTNGTGTVFIQHGITDPFDPNAFRIGSPLLNGTDGAIVTGAGTLTNFNIPNRPGIVTAVNVSVTPGGFPVQEQPTDPEQPTRPEIPTRLDPPDEAEDVITAGCPPECDFQDNEGEPPTALDISYNLVLESIANADERYTEEFTNYFGLPGRPLPTLQQLQQDLQEVEKDTGIKPAILFAILAPPTNEPADPLKGASGPTTGQPDDELEIVVITPKENPIRQRVSGVTRSQMLRATALLRQEISSPGNTRSDRYLQLSKRLYDWIIRPVQAELQTRGVESLAFVLEPGMRSLPIATLYDGNQFIIEQYSVGLMPNLSLTDTRYRDIRDFSLLGMGASTFSTQAPLPTVPVEVNTLTQQIWPSGEEYLEERFTVEELKKQSDRFGIIHLATHADFVQGTPEGSYIQLSDARLNLTQLRDLGWAARDTDVNPPVELLTLSACRTAVGVLEEEPETIIGSELGFAGVAFAAGVKTSLASLWYVSDAATTALMTEFYQTLAQMEVYRSGLLNPDLKPKEISPLKAEALRQTQLALLRGEVQIQEDALQGFNGPLSSLTLPPESIAALGSDRTFTHPYYWAAFTLIGNPW